MEAVEFIYTNKFHNETLTEILEKYHTCNDCKDKDCPHRPEWGEMVRINCFAWKGNEK